MKRWTTTVTSAALVCWIVASALAFDGNRKGFVLGAGLGVGTDSYTQEITDGIDTVKLDRESKFTLASEFKIGGGITEQFLLYFNNQVAWFSLENAFGDDVTISSGVGGIGFTWFTSPEPGGMFFTGTIGAAYWDTPFEENTNAWTGPGVIAGIGYEFSPHWSIDGSFLFGAPETTEDGLTAQTNSTSFLVTITGLAY